ncbi:MAG: D-aminoacyl-tRNA deacylase [SAR324 cluster bacterium]|nr:D-aminoacyl-tRNA deacylase [SAR324 cluster bacterium]
MRALIQRVLMSRVRVDVITVGGIEQGLLVLLGVAPDDTIADRDWLLRKILNLRIFADEEGRMNRSVTDIEGGLLVISQFTLFADVSEGNRPSFMRSAPPEFAESAYNDFLQQLRQNHSGSVATGRFAADMQVELINDGPVTLLLDSKQKNF